MAFGNECLRCGYLEEDHDNTLINEDPKEVPWANKPLKGYWLSVIECTGRPWTKIYAQRVKDMDWGMPRFSEKGYVSPDPRGEVAQYQKNMDTWVMPPPATYLIPVSGGFVAVLGD